jgi:hypothetical protein
LRRSPGGRPDEELAVDIRRHLLDADQLAAERFESIVIETEAELDSAIRDAALRDETPEDLLQHARKIHGDGRSLPACFGRPMPISREMTNATQPPSAGQFEFLSIRRAYSST